MFVEVDGSGGRERAQSQGLGRNARVDDLEVGRDRFRPLVGQDADDGRGPEGSCGVGGGVRFLSGVAWAGGGRGGGEERKWKRKGKRKWC